MKARLLVALIVMMPILAPTAALSDDDSKWASGHDGFQDFCDGITKSFSGMAKSLNGGGGTEGDDAAYGGKRGGWDNLFQAPKRTAQEIVTVEGHRKITDSKNIVVKNTDGARISHRSAHSSVNLAPLKKMIDGGGSSYAVGSMSAGAGSSHYYAMGSGIRAGGHGGWGSYGESAGSRLGGSSRYGFGGTTDGPKTSGAWGGSSAGASAGAGASSGGLGYH